VQLAERAKTSRLDRVKQGHTYTSSRIQCERKCLNIRTVVLRDIMNRWKNELYFNTTEQDRQYTYRVILGRVRLMFMPPSSSSKTAPLWHFYFAGDNETYLGLHV